MPNNDGIRSAVLQVGERESLALAINGCVVRFMSTPANRMLLNQQSGDIGNTLGGYYTALQAFCTTYTFANFDAALNNNTFFLRPVSDMTMLANARRARLVRINARAFDFSEASSGDPAAASAGAEISGWQPNFFRLQLTFDKQTVAIGNSRSNYFQSYNDNNVNLGDMSLGLPLPYCLDTNFLVNNGTGGIQAIDIYAPCGKITAIDGGGTVQAYAVMVELAFVLNEI